MPSLQLLKSVARIRPSTSEEALEGGVETGLERGVCSLVDVVHLPRVLVEIKQLGLQ